MNQKKEVRNFFEITAEDKLEMKQKKRESRNSINQFYTHVHGHTYAGMSCVGCKLYDIDPRISYIDRQANKDKIYRASRDYICLESGRIREKAWGDHRRRRTPDGYYDGLVVSRPPTGTLAKLLGCPGYTR